MDAVKTSRVLLIDDDEALGGLLHKYLAQFGFKLTAAATPESGLRLLRGDAFDIVVLDVMLPGMDGFHVLRRIREHPDTRLVPVVILTSSREEQDRLHGYLNGANSYIRKPIDFAHFVEAVRQVGLYWLVLNEPPPQHTT